jgi:hypothetical protein
VTRKNSEPQPRLKRILLDNLHGSLGENLANVLYKISPMKSKITSPRVPSKYLIIETFVAFNNSIKFAGVSDARNSNPCHMDISISLTRKKSTILSRKIAKQKMTSIFLIFRYLLDCIHEYMPSTSIPSKML